jgi:hypothetical protein
MDSKKFFSEIRTIIREEVEYAIKKYVASQQPTKVNESTRVVTNKPVQPKQTPTTSGKSALQRIMEETRQAMADSVEVGIEDIRENYAPPRPKSTEPNFSHGITENTLLNVNYSKMLKTMEEKAKANRPV